MAAIPVDPAADVAAVFDGMDTVTVERVNPDTGAALETVTGVSAHRSAVNDADSPIGSSGEAGADSCDWLVCVSDTLTFTPKARDVIEESDGTRWAVGQVTTDGDLHWCPACVKLRS